jgi:hypothetical protein
VFRLLIAGWFGVFGLGEAQAALHVLFLGDSHAVGAFGHELDSLLRQEPFEVYSYGSCGSMPDWWSIGQPTNCGYWDHVGMKAPRSVPGALTPLLEDLLSRLHPDVTIVELGAFLVRDSSVSLGDAVSQLDRMMLAIREAGSRCIWIGPADGRAFDPQRFADFYSALLEVGLERDCDVIDSRGWIEYPAAGGDGISYDSAGPAGIALAQTWAKDAFRVLDPWLAEPGPKSGP